MSWTQHKRALTSTLRAFFLCLFHSQNLLFCIFAKRKMVIKVWFCELESRKLSFTILIRSTSKDRMSWMKRAKNLIFCFSSFCLLGNEVGSGYSLWLSRAWKKKKICYRTRSLVGRCSWSAWLKETILLQASKQKVCKAFRWPPAPPEKAANVWKWVSFTITTNGTHPIATSVGRDQRWWEQFRMGKFGGTLRVRQIMCWLFFRMKSGVARAWTERRFSFRLESACLVATKRKPHVTSRTHLKARKILFFCSGKDRGERLVACPQPSQVQPAVPSIKSRTGDTVAIHHHTIIFRDALVLNEIILTAKK